MAMMAARLSCARNGLLSRSTAVPNAAEALFRAVTLV
jgi:hypothetical protein